MSFTINRYVSVTLQAFNAAAEAEVTLRLTVSQPIKMSRCGAHCGAFVLTLILSVSCCLVSVGRPL
jgi:hypothetical protein